MDVHLGQVDGKLALRGVSPQSILDRRLLDLVVCGEWLLRCLTRVFADVSIYYYQFSVVFNLQIKSKRMKMTINIFFCVILIVIGHFTASCLLLVLSFIFLKNYKRYKMSLASLLKKEGSLYVKICGDL
jgi:hypothetical protein